MKRLVLIFFLALSCCALKAQFSLTGSDPGRIRWSSMDTPGFRIIFPVGEDSLARVYGAWLEKASTAVSWSSGMRIGEYYRGKMPVVLHSFLPIANASVTWAPKRLDIYTNPDPYAPTPIPWEKLLAIHEGRHAAQMQAGAGGRNKVLKILTGELFAGAVAGLYSGPTLLEGDAVTTETALTQSGRGRQGAFLSYMAPAFDSGDWRDYWRWSLGSDRHFTPDHYRAGFMLVAGTRVFFNDPLFTEEYFSKVKKWGFLPLKKTVKAASGLSLKKSYRVIEEKFHEIWSEEAAAREPFMISSQVSLSPWRHTSYSGSVIDDNGNIWSVKSGLTTPTSLVRLSSTGEEVRLRSFASYTSPLAYDKTGGKIWWSETVSGRRWTLGGSSRIRYVDISSPEKARDLTTEGKYFNPSPSPDGSFICATEYPASGGSRLVVLRVSDGKVERTLEAPDTLQFTESAWIGERLFAAGLSNHGTGIYEVFPDKVRNIIGPQPVELSSLRTAPSSENENGCLAFVCDRTGVNELYLLNVDSGELTQATSTRYGISSPIFNAAGDTLYFSSLAPSDKPEAYRQGRMIYSTPTKDLPMRNVDFCDIHKYPVAEALTEQEKALQSGDGWDSLQDYSETTFSEPRRYHKLFPTLHSWAPIYFNYDNIESASGDNYYKTASPGATALFQNLVGDGYGFIGYGYHPDPDLAGVWRHSGHIKYLYTGLFPVFEFSFDYGDRAAKEMVRVQQKDPEKGSLTIFTANERRVTPYMEGYLRAYIPFNFDSGGVSRGVVPSVRLRMSNDLFNDKISLREKDESKDESTAKETGFLGNDHVSPLRSLDFSLRGYIIRDKAPAAVYPRLGAGAEVGFRTRPGHTAAYSNTMYLYTYGYLPGILQNQGIRVSATMGTSLGGGHYSYPESSASFSPRGFEGTNLKAAVNSCAPQKVKFSFDYAAPFLNLDWSGLSPLVYIKRLTIIPFFDVAYYKFNKFNDFHINKNAVDNETLASVGTDLSVKLGNLFWLPYDAEIGVRYARNFWKDIEKLNVRNVRFDYFGMIFNVSL